MKALWSIFSLCLLLRGEKVDGEEAAPELVNYGKGVLKHVEDRRVFEDFELENGVRVVIVSDINATFSMVRLNIGWGLLDSKSHFEDTMNFFERKFMKLVGRSDAFSMQRMYHKTEFHDKDFTYFELTAPGGPDDFTGDLEVFARAFETKLGDPEEENETTRKLLGRLDEDVPLSEDELESLWNLFLLRARMHVVIYTHLKPGEKLHDIGHKFDGLRKRAINFTGRRRAQEKYLDGYIASAAACATGERVMLAKLSLEDYECKQNLIVILLRLLNFEHKESLGFRFRMLNFYEINVSADLCGDFVVVKVRFNAYRTDLEDDGYDKGLDQALLLVRKFEVSKEMFERAVTAYQSSYARVVNNEGGRALLSRISTGMMHFDVEYALIHQYLFDSDLSYVKFVEVLEFLKNPENWSFSRTSKEILIETFRQFDLWKRGAADVSGLDLEVSEEEKTPSNK
jgi:hypothetical protein